MKFLFYAGKHSLGVMIYFQVLIHHLMRILNSASNMGVGPQAAEFQVERPTLYTTVKSHTTIETGA